jgi:hypothetical protein
MWGSFTAPMVGAGVAGILVHVTGLGTVTTASTEQVNVENRMAL